MSAMPFYVTFKADAPGGYGGTHWFRTMRDRNGFVKRAAERGVGPEYIAGQGKA